MHRDDPLKRAMAELDTVELDGLLDATKTLSFQADHNPVRAYWLAVAAHLNVESRRRARAMAWIDADLDDSAGEQVIDLAQTIEDARRELRADVY